LPQFSTKNEIIKKKEQKYHKIKIILFLFKKFFFAFFVGKDYLKYIYIYLKIMSIL